jgi:hypothetical protein
MEFYERPMGGDARKVKVSFLPHDTHANSLGKVCQGISGILWKEKPELLALEISLGSSQISNALPQSSPILTIPQDIISWSSDFKLPASYLHHHGSSAFPEVPEPIHLHNKEIHDCITARVESNIPTVGNWL